MYVQGCMFESPSASNMEKASRSRASWPAESEGFEVSSVRPTAGAARDATSGTQSSTTSTFRSRRGTCVGARGAQLWLIRTNLPRKGW